MISNLSAEAIYIHNLIVQLCSSDDCLVEAAVTDPSDNNNDLDIINKTNQGPLKPGEYRHIGSFRHFIERILEDHQADNSTNGIKKKNIKRLNIIVIASYGADDTPIAAKREFYFNETGNIMPSTVATQQIRSNKERRKLTNYIKNVVYSS